MRPLVCVLVLVGLSLATDGPKAEPPVGKVKMWAGVGVTSPTVRADDVTNSKFFMVSFALVNDGDRAVAPEVESSQLFVNDKELKDWGLIVGNGPKGKDFESLAPGQTLRFGYAMGQVSAEPGVYKIRWKGKSFESAAVEFRVLPAQPK